MLNHTTPTRHSVKPQHPHDTQSNHALEEKKENALWLPIASHRVPMGVHWAASSFRVKIIMSRSLPSYNMTSCSSVTTNCSKKCFLHTSRYSREKKNVQRRDVRCLYFSHRSRHHSRKPCNNSVNVHMWRCKKTNNHIFSPIFFPRG